MSNEDAVWAALFTAGLGYEAYSLCRKDFDRTATRTARRWFYTHHPVGKTAFTVGWMGFAAWFAWHIVQGSDTARPLKARDLGL